LIFVNFGDFAMFPPWISSPVPNLNLLAGFDLAGGGPARGADSFWGDGLFKILARSAHVAVDAVGVWGGFVPVWNVSGGACYCTCCGDGCIAVKLKLLGLQTLR